MSTTTPRTLKAGADVRLRGVYESYVQALGDLDKAGDVEDAAYYQGEVDAYLDVLDTFGELEPDEEGPQSLQEQDMEDQFSSDAETENDTAEVRKTRLDIETGGNYA